MTLVGPLGDILQSMITRLKPDFQRPIAILFYTSSPAPINRAPQGAEARLSTADSAGPIPLPGRALGGRHFVAVPPCRPGSIDLPFSRGEKEF